MCVDGERWPDRPLIARDKLTCYEWLCPRLSGATGAQRGRSLASEADTASTLVVWVAAGCSAARLLRYFGSRQKFSFFRLSGAATRVASHVIGILIWRSPQRSGSWTQWQRGSVAGAAVRRSMNSHHQERAPMSRRYALESHSHAHHSHGSSRLDLKPCCECSC